MKMHIRKKTINADGIIHGNAYLLILTYIFMSHHLGGV
jgi:hypothetical protein